MDVVFRHVLKTNWIAEVKVSQEENYDSLFVRPLQTNN